MMKLGNFIDCECKQQGSRDMRDGLIRDAKGRDVLKQPWVWKIENNESQAELLQV